MTKMFRICIDPKSKNVKVAKYSSSDGEKGSFLGEESFDNINLIEIRGTTRIFLDVLSRDVICIHAEADNIVRKERVLKVA